jgi:hypothetical protein
VQRLLFHKGKDVVDPTGGLAPLVAQVGVASPQESPAAGWKPFHGVLVLKAAQRELLDIVFALHLSRGLARRLHRRQQQGHEDADDRDDDQKLHQCEAGPEGRKERGNRSHRLLDSYYVHIPTPVLTPNEIQ